MDCNKVLLMYKSSVVFITEVIIELHQVINKPKPVLP